MKLLLDTHALLWWLSKDAKLSQGAMEAISNPDNLVFVSAASAWEIAIKKAIGKLTAPDNLKEALDANNFLELPITIEHCQTLYQLPLHHQDPFDRIMLAQAMSERLILVSRDAKFTLYEISMLQA
ncbi:type II toxin-antitoxin system VapC family toxin [Merismopedia glauca]|uniref:PIN domain nuclease n=1 Tax=Merismopedia glauca CCAP 1448/3 TaxID=1296344 RepID=A0A2T1C4L9_9CYAN|nr:type II toxin-antitoxin system VapC family toxin [Merismopedia glauca]PSB03225.1 PIN domain nuclease [Merismopedia glauca CCAP 1448/3]